MSVCWRSVMQNALAKVQSVVFFSRISNKMPGIQKGLLRLCRRGRKKENDSVAYNPNHGNESQSQQHGHTCMTCQQNGPSTNSYSKSDDPASETGSDMALPSVQRPLACLEKQCEDIQLALIVLNQPLKSLQQQLEVLWRRSVLKATADGGSNRLYECMMGRHQNYIPDLVSGDFDSIRPEILLYYQNRGAKVVETQDQDYTDFTKCLRIVIEMIHKSRLKVDAIVALGALGGRFDQTCASLNTLYEASTLSKLPLYLLAERSLACLLQPGKHAIQVNTGLEDSWCGLLPVGAKCRQVTTTGLKWNLDHQAMEFGRLISTSNTYSEGTEVVTVQTDQPLVWTMGFKDYSSESDAK